MKLGMFRNISEEDAAEVAAQEKVKTSMDYVLDNDALIDVLSKTPISQLEGLQLDDFKKRKELDKDPASFKCTNTEQRPISPGSNLMHTFKCRSFHGHVAPCDFRLMP